MKNFHKIKCKTTCIESTRQRFSFCASKQYAMIELWRSGNLAVHILNFRASWRWSPARPGHCAPTGRAPGIHWIGGRVVTHKRSEGFGVDKNNVLHLLGFEP
jgi:hypothetical protein